MRPRSCSVDGAPSQRHTRVVAKHLRRPPEQTFGARIGYRIDRFLALHPLIQLTSVLVAATALAFLFGVTITVLDQALGVSAGCHDQPGCEARSVTGGLWWAITRMLDGGTVGADTGSGLLRQTFGLGVTLVGLVAVTLLTGAFASSFSERLAAIRRGSLPVFERGHVLLLGWNANAGVIVRELARSGVAARVAVVADRERDALEDEIRSILEGAHHRIDVIVRRGDPSTVATIRRAGARKAAAIVILPDQSSPRAADRAAIRAQLALDRVLGDVEPRPHVVIEVATREGRAMVSLCEKPRNGDRARGGNGAHGPIVVEGRDVNALALAQAVRFLGAFSVVRQILSLDEIGLYMHDAGDLAGRSFEAAHLGLEHGALVGVIRDGAPLLVPTEELTIDAGDQLVVLNDRDDKPVLARRPPRDGVAPLGHASEAEPLRVLVMRYRAELVSVLDFLDERGPVHATLLAPRASIEAARAALDEAALEATTTDFIEGDPLDRATIERALASAEGGFDAALLLSPEVPHEGAPEADADQIISLLQLHQCSGAPEHAVVELRSPETRPPRKVGQSAGVGVVIAHEITGMILAREVYALAFGKHASYPAALDAFIPMITLRPLRAYARDRAEVSFDDLVIAARQRGEIAIGVALKGHAPRLVPPRAEVFAVDGARAVVLHRY